MQNTSKIISSLTIFYCTVLNISGLSNIALASNLSDKAKCDKKLSISTNKNTFGLMSSICDINGNRIDLIYSKQSRKIWLRSKRFKHIRFMITQLDKGANPEFIGAEHDIQILFGKTINIQEREFLFLTISERTNRGNGGGQCGSGEEINLKVYELIDNNIFERNTLLIHSCASFIELDPGDGNNKANSWPININNNTLQIKWLGYPNYQGRTLGSYNVLENRWHIESMPVK